MLSISGEGFLIVNIKYREQWTGKLPCRVFLIPEFGVAIAWAGTHGAVPMIGPRSLTQLSSNLGALALELSAEHLDRLDTVTGIDPSAPKRKPVPWASDEKAVRAVA